MNHPTDEILTELVGNYEQVADSVKKIKTLYEQLNLPFPATVDKATPGDPYAA